MSLFGLPTVMKRCLGDITRLRVTAEITFLCYFNRAKVTFGCLSRWLLFVTVYILVDFGELDKLIVTGFL